MLCSLALLKDLIEILGRRFIDILVADAIYLQAPFVREVELLGLDWVINLMAPEFESASDNPPSLLAEAERLTSGPSQDHETTSQQDLKLWHAPEVDWPVADRTVRVVKTVRVQNAKCVKVEEIQVEAPLIEEPKTKNNKGKNSQPKKPKCKRVKTKKDDPIVSTDFYASNGDLGAIPPYFIHQLGRSRWTIDVQAFQTITTGARVESAFDCHLQQPSAHQYNALVVLTMIRWRKS